MSKLLERRLGNQVNGEALAISTGKSTGKVQPDAKSAPGPNVVLVNKGRRNSEPAVGSFPMAADDSPTQPKGSHRSRRRSLDLGEQQRDFTRSTSPGSPDSTSPVSSPTSTTSAWSFWSWGSGNAPDSAGRSRRNSSSVGKRRSSLTQTGETSPGTRRRSSFSIAGTLAVADAGGNVNVVDITDEKKEERMFHRLRRGVGARPLNFYELADHATEQIVSTSVITPWYLQPCVKSATCQRVCFPAEYATRNKKKHDAHHGHSVSDAEHKGMLGLPQFDVAGYDIVPDSEVSWPDKQVYTILGLRKAVQRVSSLERYCFMSPKSKIPPGCEKETLMRHLHSLQQLDHVNILRCHEIFEDEDDLYFMYEFFPCFTLASVLEKLPWAQRDQVNLVRECCAAVSCASHLDVQHLGWTHWHVLLPRTCWNGGLDLAGAKIFGFGLNGVALVDASVTMFWSPEAIQHHQRWGESFAWHMPTSMKVASDCWSLGALAYTIVARRPPFVGQGKIVTEAILVGKWSFTVAFDLVDTEAKKLVEGLMNMSENHRMAPALAIKSEWIRRHGAYDAKLAGQIFAKAEEFVNSSLPKRLFGRFLVKFLDADQLRKIMRSFYALDCNCDGQLCAADLKMAAKHAGRTPSASNAVLDWFVPGTSGHKSISLSCFAESMAEEVIDGRALRHAFESLDDDGSECISADELYERLSMFDSRLTHEEIVQHIELAEENAGEEGAAGSDHMIDFSEFCELFPVRCQRLKHLEERRKGLQEQGLTLDGQLRGLGPVAAHWISELKGALEQLHHLQTVAIDQDRAKAVKSMKDVFKRISKTMRSPPGPSDANKMLYRMTKYTSKLEKRKKGKTDKQKQSEEFYGYDSFLQDRAVEEMWTQLINAECKEMEREVVTKDEDGKLSVDHFKAIDLAEQVDLKVKEVLNWVTYQQQEYTSFAEVLDASLEAAMPSVPYSCRGLRRPKEEDANCANDWNNVDQDASSGLAVFFNGFLW